MSVPTPPESRKGINKKIVEVSKAMWRLSYERIFGTLQNGKRVVVPLLLTLILLTGCTIPFKKGEEDIYLPVPFNHVIPSDNSDTLVHSAHGISLEPSHAVEESSDELPTVTHTELHESDGSERSVTPTKPHRSDEPKPANPQEKNESNPSGMPAIQQTSDESESTPVNNNETAPSEEDWLTNLTPQKIKDIADNSTQFTPEELSRLEIQNWEYFGSIDAPARAKDIDVVPVRDDGGNTVGYLVLWISNDNVSKEWYEQHPNGDDIPDELLAKAPIRVAVLGPDGIVDAVSNDMPDDIRKKFLNNPELIRGFVSEGFGAIQMTCSDYVMCGSYTGDSGAAPATTLLLFIDRRRAEEVKSVDDYGYYREAIKQLSKQGMESGRQRATKRLKRFNGSLRQRTQPPPWHGKSHPSYTTTGWI